MDLVLRVESIVLFCISYKAEFLLYGKTTNLVNKVDEILIGHYLDSLQLLLCVVLLDTITTTIHAKFALS